METQAKYNIRRETPAVTLARLTTDEKIPAILDQLEKLIEHGYGEMVLRVHDRRISLVTITKNGNSIDEIRNI